MYEIKESWLDSSDESVPSWLLELNNFQLSSARDLFPLAQKFHFSSKIKKRHFLSLRFFFPFLPCILFTLFWVFVRFCWIPLQSVWNCWKIINGMITRREHSWLTEDTHEAGVRQNSCRFGNSMKVKLNKGNQGRSTSGCIPCLGG